MSFSFIWLRLAALAVMAASTPITFGEPIPNSLEAAVNAAWLRSVQGRTLEARRDQVAAAGTAARAWTSGAPSIGLAERSDRWTNQTGRRETEVSLSTPVWMPGQKAARLSLAQAGAEDLDAQTANNRLIIAGQVREQMWAVAAARETLAEAKEHLQHLEKLADEVAQRVKSGDLARSDSMLAQQEVLAARAAVASAYTKVSEAMSRYALLTGLPDIPNPVPEPVGNSPPPIHPRLAMAQAALQHSQASKNVVLAMRSEPPVIGVAMRREQDGANAGSNRSISLMVQIPIGTAARNRPLESAANTALETAAAELAQAEASLQSDISLALQQLIFSQQALGDASKRTALTGEHLQLVEKAFRLGERGLSDLLRAQILAHEADAAERQQRVAAGLAHARLNQVKGILP